MKFWKRKKSSDTQTQDLTGIILQDLGDDPKLWLTFFKKNPKAARSLCHQNNKWGIFDKDTLSEICLLDIEIVKIIIKQKTDKLSLDHWLRIFDSYANGEFKDDEKFQELVGILKPCIKEKLKDSSTTAILDYMPLIKRMFSDKDLQEFDWYKELQSKEEYPKLRISSILSFSVLLVAAAVIFVCLSWPFPTFSLKGNSVWNGVVELVVIAICCGTALFACLNIQKKWLLGKAVIVFGVIAAIGTSLGCFAMFYRPDGWQLGWKLCWLVPIVISTLILWIIFMVVGHQGKVEYASSGLMTLSILFFVVLPAAFLIAWGVFPASNKKIAETCHEWKWHGHETWYLGRWRLEAGGEYARLWNKLDAAVKSAEEMDDAFMAISKADPVRKCYGKDIDPPWLNDLRDLLAVTLEKDYYSDKKSDKWDWNSQLENENKLYARLAFCRDKFPNHDKVEPSLVLDHYFKPYLKKAAKVYDKTYFHSVKDHFQKFADNDSIRHASAKTVLKPVLKQLLDTIKDENQKEAIVSGNGRPTKESAKVLKSHEYFRTLRSVSEEFDVHAALEDIFDDYDKYSRERNKKLKKFVTKASEQVEKEPSAVSDWNYCDVSWLEQFRMDIPLTNYILWKYGHEPSGIQKNDRGYLTTLEKRADDPEYSYYAAKIYEEIKDSDKARDYYTRTADSFNRKEELKSSRSLKEKYIDSLHKKAELNDGFPARKWEAWKCLDDETRLNNEEKLQMARACIGRKEIKRMIRLYKNIPEEMLTTKDYFDFLRNSNEKTENLKWFEKLARRMMKEDNSSSDVSQFYEIGRGMDSHKADEFMVPILENSVRKGMSDVTAPYIETVIRLNRDFPDDTIIDILSKDPKAADLCYDKMIRTKSIDDRKNIFHLWAKVVPVEDAQLSRISNLWTDKFGKEEGLLLLKKLEAGVKNKFEKIYPHFSRLAIQMGKTELPDDVATNLLSSSSVDLHERIRLARQAERDDLYVGLCVQALNEGLKLDQSDIENCWSIVVQKAQWEHALSIWNKLDPAKKNDIDNIKKYFRVIMMTEDFSNQNIEFIFSKLSQDNQLTLDFDLLLKLSSYFERQKDDPVAFFLLRLCLQKYEKVKPADYKKHCGEICWKLYNLLRKGNQVSVSNPNSMKYSFREKAKSDWSNAVVNGEFPRYIKNAALEYEQKDAVLELAKQGAEADGEFVSLAEANKDKLKAILKRFLDQNICTGSEQDKIKDWLKGWP